jgi:hypothetical protein
MERMGLSLSLMYDGSPLVREGNLTTQQGFTLFIPLDLKSISLSHMNLVKELRFRVR